MFARKLAYIAFALFIHKRYSNEKIQLSAKCTDPLHLLESRQINFRSPCGRFINSPVCLSSQSLMKEMPNALKPKETLQNKLLTARYTQKVKRPASHQQGWSKLVVLWQRTFCSPSPPLGDLKTYPEKVLLLAIPTWSPVSTTTRTAQGLLGLSPSLP